MDNPKINKNLQGYVFEALSINYFAAKRIYWVRFFSHTVHLCVKIGYKGEELKSCDFYSTKFVFYQYFLLDKCYFSIDYSKVS
jgi:hypothetical protein